MENKSRINFACIGLDKLEKNGNLGSKSYRIVVIKHFVDHTKKIK